MIGVIPVALNFDLLSVGVIVGAIVILGFILLFSDKNSTVSKTFFLLSLAISFWSIFNYVSYQVTGSILTVWMVRFVFFSATAFAFFLYIFAHVFPRGNLTFSNVKLSLLVLWTMAISALTLTPYLVSYTDLTPEGTASTVHMSWGLPFFAATVVFYLFGSLIILFKKTQRAQNEEQKQFKIVGAGFGLTFALLIIFNFILPAYFKISFFIPFGAFFVFPFVLLTFYAIYKHQLFNVKVISTGLITILFSIVTFLQIIYAKDLTQIIFQSAVFFLVLTFGVLLIRGVLREIEQREKIEKLATELQLANDQQTVLIHFITHQIKGFFTMSRNIFSLMLENTFGELNPEMRRMTQQGFDNTTKGVTTVQEILNAANLKKGTVAMKMAAFDIRELVEQVLGELKPRIEAAALHVESTLPQGPLSVMGDRFQLHEVFKNLIDNAIRYTPKGTITVKLGKKDSVAHFEIKDSGVGLSDDDKKKLFTEGGRGKESLKVNVDSTGFGLYIVKGIVDQHKGKVWADSEGQGKGSTFNVDLPLAS